jgi:multidrug resistance efflux pump
VAGRIVKDYVALGSAVTTGQPLAQLDTAMLDLGVAQARTAAIRAHAQVAVLDSALDTLSDNQSKLTTAKSKLATAGSQLASAGSQLSTALSQATAGRAQLVAAIAALEKLISHMPTSTSMPTSTPPPGPNPRVLLAQLKAKLAQLDAAIALLQAGFGKLATGQAQLATGRAQLASAGSQLAKARDQLQTARDVAGIAAEAQDLGIQVAQVERGQARVLSPVSGRVTYTLSAGSLAMVGTPLDTITPDRPVLVDTYVADSQLGLVRLGQTVDVTYDSEPDAVLHGRVTTIGSSSTFPPTSFPTNLIHLTRALRVTITLDRGPAPPPGTPVDLTIHTRG